jgi:hypothetical protein
MLLTTFLLENNAINLFVLIVRMQMRNIRIFSVSFYKLKVLRTFINLLINLFKGKLFQTTNVKDVIRKLILLNEVIYRNCQTILFFIYKEYVLTMINLKIKK